jgi:hypothetical protein
VNLSISNIIAGFIFGVFGFAIFRKGRKDDNKQQFYLGLALMIFPYLVSNEWLTWIIGSVLLFFGLRTYRL